MIVHNNLFGDLEGLFTRLSSTATASTPSSTSATTRYTTPPIDVYRRDSDVWVHVDLPGVSNDSLDIDIERSVLTITAKRELLRQDGDHRFRSERRRGTFRRSINLGDSLDPKGIEANFSDGVLTLRIPEAEQAKARKIDVNFGHPVDSPSETDVTDTEAVVIDTADTAK